MPFREISKYGVDTIAHIFQPYILSIVTISSTTKPMSYFLNLICKLSFI